MTRRSTQSGNRSRWQSIQAEVLNQCARRRVRIGIQKEMPANERAHLQVVLGHSLPLRGTCGPCRSIVIAGINRDGASKWRGRDVQISVAHSNIFGNDGLKHIEKFRTGLNCCGDAAKCKDTLAQRPGVLLARASFGRRKTGRHHEMFWHPPIALGQQAGCEVGD